ncbi:MAG: TlpA family protein disulfide reductase [Gemmatimonadetes bacterium]|nr:TlpA family protein disulfide reductase [Gemmatimonadota bacterium]NNM06225.1 TlpA family protein disulfide reductase [Gemmatimonadota bacterium]
MKSAWDKAKRPLEFLLWAGVLGFVFLRLGPQVTAAVGVGGGDEPLSVGAFTALDGTEFGEADLRGKVVLVNAWATWCRPCVIEMPAFQRVYDDYRDQGFLVLGVSRDRGDPSVVSEFLTRKGISYPVAMAMDVDLGGITEVNTLPTSYLIGRDGTIRHKVEGLYAGPALRMAVKRLLAEG